MLLDFNLTCRLCLIQDAQLTPIFKDVDKTELPLSFASKILACVSIEVKIGDNMPNQICNKCIQQLDDWIKFKEVCDNSNLILQQNVTTSQTAVANTVTDMTRQNLTEKSKGKENQDSLPDICGNFFEQDSLFRIFEDSQPDTWQSADCLSTEFTENILSPIFKCPTPKENNSIVDNNGTNSKKPSKYKEKYDRIYKSHYICEICNKEFSKYSKLVQHDETDHKHLMKSDACPVCGRLFVSENRVSLHVKMKHREKTHECDICGVKTVSKKCLLIHKRRHNGKFVCNVCGLTTTSRDMLNIHQRKHTGERPFKCENCDANFASKKVKDFHMKTHDKSTIHYKCNICSAIVGSSGALRTHLTTHTTERPNMCDLCGKTFKTATSLNNHIKTHLEKTFSCSVCDKRFLTKTLVHKHLLTHSRVKAFVCGLCGKSYNRQDTLKFHIELHTGEKKFSCDICNKSFILQRDLKKHVKRLHSSSECLEYSD